MTHTRARALPITLHRLQMRAQGNESLDRRQLRVPARVVRALQLPHAVSCDSAAQLKRLEHVARTRAPVDGVDYVVDRANDLTRGQVPVVNSALLVTAVVRHVVVVVIVIVGGRALLRRADDLENAEIDAVVRASA